MPLKRQILDESGPKQYLMIFNPRTRMTDCIQDQQIEDTNLLMTVLFLSDPKCSYLEKNKTTLSQFEYSNIVVIELCNDKKHYSSLYLLLSLTC